MFKKMKFLYFYVILVYILVLKGRSVIEIVYKNFLISIIINGVLCKG